MWWKRQDGFPQLRVDGGKVRSNHAYATEGTVSSCWISPGSEDKASRSSKRLSLCVCMHFNLSQCFCKSFIVIKVKHALISHRSFSHTSMTPGFLYYFLCSTNKFILSFFLLVLSALKKNSSYTFQVRYFTDTSSSLLLQLY